MKKKIALMTWHHVENYGTAFQAYALKTVLEKFECRVDVINYQRSYDGPPRQIRLWPYLKGHLSMIRAPVPSIYAGLKIIDFNKFFDKYFTYTERCRTNNDFGRLNAEYDGFVCGSDQIWGPEWFDRRYFLDFVEDSRRMIAYAPSFGVSDINDEDIRSEMKKNLERFQALSVREITGCRIVSDLTGDKDVFNAIDPVFLLGRTEWQKLILGHVPEQSHYMLVFFLKNNPRYFEVAIEKAKRLGLNPIVLHCTQSEDNTYANINSLSPEQLLSYIHSAAYVCTDSFHIMALSIIFEVQFEVFMKDSNKEKGSRIRDLLGRLQIENHIFSEGENEAYPIEYIFVNRIIKKEREKSLRYLHQAIDSLSGYNTIFRTNCHFSRKADECYGKSLLKEVKPHTIDAVLRGRMEKWGFALYENCYSCKYCNFAQGKVPKPIFYDRLTRDAKEKSLFELYIKYYVLYDLPKLIKGIFRND